MKTVRNLALADHSPGVTKTRRKTTSESQQRNVQMAGKHRGARKNAGRLNNASRPLPSGQGVLPFAARPPPANRLPWSLTVEQSRLQCEAAVRADEQRIAEQQGLKAGYSSKTMGTNRELLVSKSHVDGDDRVLNCG